MPSTTSSLPRPEAFFHYASMVETLFEKDPVAMGLAVKMPVASLRAYIRSYHRDHVIAGSDEASAGVRETYLRNLEHNVVLAAAPGYNFSLN